MTNDEFELSRLRSTDLGADLSRATRSPARVAARITSTTSLVVGNYLMMQPFTVMGSPIEGGPATLTNLGSTFPVLWLGPKTPATGDQAVASFEGNRWITTKRVHGGITGGPVDISGCACQGTPTTVNMSSVGLCNGTFNADAITYGPTPPSLSSLDLGANCYLGVTTFHDPLLARDYRFVLVCDTIFYRLSRVYLASGAGGAYHDSTLYTWSMGVSGNTCSPFLLSNGTIYPGGDPRCVVTISG